MFRIAVCEDDNLFSAFLVDCLKDIYASLELEIAIDTFKSGGSFLNAFFSDTAKYDLIFMDIMLENSNGMETAKKIRLENEEVTLVFITGNKDYIIDGYDVGATNYLLKPLDKEKLKTLLYKNYDKKYAKYFITLKGENGMFKIAAKDIIALETVSRKVAIYLEESTYFYKGKIAELYQTLPQNIFIRCHQSYVVNIRKIKIIEKSSIIMATGREIPLSRKYMKEVHQAFLEGMR